MELEESLQNKLDRRVNTFISELEHSDDRMFTYSELMPIFLESLYEYSIVVYGEKNEKFINEQIDELKENINPAVRDMTDGTDEIIASLSVIEIAKIIYREGVGEDEFGRKEYRPELDDGREAVYRALRYLYPEAGSGPNKKISERLGNYIYRNKKGNSLKQNSGCLVIFIFFSGIFSLFITTL